ncbi:MAG: UDP-N-acetylglucosamine 4,6-dehydratase (inverting) [Acidobacteriota bacterium]
MRPFIWDNATVLVTGGTGSFGRKFIGTLLAQHKPKKVIVFSRDELKQHEMRQHFPDGPGSVMRYFIGDVRDPERLRRAFGGVDLVVHAAALKQVPACEYNPFEAVQTNIQGAKNIVDAAIDLGVPRVVGLSTDKAVSPVNLYGATKLVAEKIFVQGNTYSAGGETRFACVRYGNVVGSRGSVVPLFLEQAKTGTITITDERMTRFWITLEQGVRFVMNAAEQMHGGEVFVPKLPSMRLSDLAKVVAPQCAVRVVGIRPGEKLHELLFSEDEARQTLEFDDMYIIQPMFPWWNPEPWSGGRKLADEFRYSSETNVDWLSNPALLRMIEDHAGAYARG